MSLVHVKDLSVRYEDRSVLNRISLQIRQGELLGILGANGSGKSTLLRSMIGLMRYNQGEIYIKSKEITRYKPKELAKVIGYVPQDTSLDFDFSVRDVVMMGRHAHLSRFSAETALDQEVVNQAMQAAGVSHLAERSIAELSGGQRQLVFIAKALAQEPELLVLDEPISALDIKHQLHVLELLRSITLDRGTASVAALHDLNLAARYCDRIALLSGGQMVAVGKPDQVLTKDSIQSVYGVHAEIRSDPVIGSIQITALAQKLHLS